MNKIFEWYRIVEVKKDGSFEYFDEDYYEKNFETLEEADHELSLIIADFEGWDSFDKSSIKIVKETRQVVK